MSFTWQRLEKLVKGISPVVRQAYGLLGVAGVGERMLRGLFVCDIVTEKTGSTVIARLQPQDTRRLETRHLYRVISHKVISDNPLR